jgi:hypothetical protein
MHFFDSKSLHPQQLMLRAGNRFKSNHFLYVIFVFFCISFVLFPPLIHQTSSSSCVWAGLIAHLYAHPSYNAPAVGALELANALAACCLSSRLSSQHRQWAAQQLVRTLAAHDRDNCHAQPLTLADMAGDLRKCPMVKLEAHQSRVGHGPPSNGLGYWNVLKMSIEGLIIRWLLNVLRVHSLENVASAKKEICHCWK